MKSGAIWTTILAFFMAAAGLWAGEFKPYPGSVLDQKATEKAKIMAAQSGVEGVMGTVYTTEDPIEKVEAFYRNLAKEYEMPGIGKTRKLSTGQELRQIFFIFDGADDLASSKLWIMVQNPYIADQKLKDIRNVTAIVITKRQ